MTLSSCYFHRDLICEILNAFDRQRTHIDLSLDLNLSQTRCLLKEDHLWITETTSIHRRFLEPLQKSKGKIFVWKDHAFCALEFRSDAYYKLVPTSSAPILEINGIKMHRSKEIDPFEDARQKTERIVRPGDRVLDTCGGLGYSACFAMKAGARQVICVEKKEEVIALRNANPWFEKLLAGHSGVPAAPGQGLRFICGDITDEINGFDNNAFQSILHDPPRFSSSTGDLYGKHFYDALFRIMAPGGRLFHYTGSPKRIKNGSRFVLNTMRRLESSGFSTLEFIDHLQGIEGKK